MSSVLLIGSGGREDALLWKLAQSPEVSTIWVLPGNDGMCRHAKAHRILESLTPQNILRAAQRYKPSLVVIGPEKPIVEGVSDLLRTHGFDVCAPSAQAARLEGSKIFSKEFMCEYAIPTARYSSADSYEEALGVLDKWDYSEGIVVKSDALAGGKGVVVCSSKTRAKEVVQQFMLDPNIQIKTQRILFEEILHGKELSAFALLDGAHVCSIGYACDYKRAYDGDRGANTGGMGTYTPIQWLSDLHKSKIHEIFVKAARGMKKRGHPYIGVLFAGLMIKGTEVWVVEFNIRFGDPETQVLMPIIDDDLFPLLRDAAKGELSQKSVSTHGCAVHVVLASQGYPSIGTHPVQTGFPIDISSHTEGLLFFAGVGKKNGLLCTSGGRVMGVTGVGETLNEARTIAYRDIEKIHFEGMHYRRDIGKE